MEHSVGKLRSAIESMGKLNKEGFAKVVFDLNNSEHQDGSGTPSEKFFFRGVRSYLPNSVRQEVDRRSMVKKRMDAQQKLSEKKGYKSADTFKLGDLVRIKTL